MYGSIYCKEHVAMNFKRFLSGLLVVLLVLFAMPCVGMAADYNVSDGDVFDLSSVSDGDTIRVAGGAAATIKGSKNVMIECSAGVTLTLDAVNIDVRATDNACALSFKGSGNTLILIGDSTLKSGKNEPGVRVEETTSLEIKGSGSLVVIGGDFAAGIGSGVEISGGKINISEGFINVYGGYQGAGIGSGDGDDDTNGYTGGEITVSGGNVTATGGEDAAGIGGGCYCDGGKITITGGYIDAYGTYSGAGIGGGDGCDGGTIYISGGYVDAFGATNGAGIGGGSRGGIGDITIEGDAQVTATGYGNASGIGGGAENLRAGTIMISGNSKVKAQSGDSGAGIGGGYFGRCGEITIDGNAQVTATSIYSGAGIGGGSDDNGGKVTIKGGTVTAQGGENGAGIGGGWDSEGVDVIIEGGTVKATGGKYGAGIGGGYEGNGGKIDISGGVVYAVKDENGSNDIGNGEIGGSWEILISGSAAVLMSTNSCSPSPTTSSHTRYEITEDTQELYGISIPADWTPTFGAYLVLCDLEYDANGGSGNTPGVTEMAAGVVVEAAANQFTRSNYFFDSWNTETDGSGDSYMPDDEIVLKNNMLLFAQWTEIISDIRLSKSSKSMYVGQTYLLTAVITPASSTATVTWSSSNNDSAVVINGKVYATGEGRAVIKAEVMDKSAVCTIYVRKSATDGDDDDDDAAYTPGVTKTPAPTETPEPEQTENLETFTIMLSNLPDGTLAVILPDDRVIKLTGETTQIEIDSKYIRNGEIELIALDENIPLASGEEIEISEADDTQSSGMKAWLWVLIGLSGAGVCGAALYLILRKRKTVS